MTLVSTAERGSAAEVLLKKYFGSDAMKWKHEIYRGYGDALRVFGNSPTYKCVAQGTGPCDPSTDAYVGAHPIIFGNPTIICDKAFKDDDLELADTILHEATHLGDWTNDLEPCSRSTGCSLETTDQVLPGIGVTDRGALNNAYSYAMFASEAFAKGL
jgi:hypothetical protein